MPGPPITIPTGIGFPAPSPSASPTADPVPGTPPTPAITPEQQFQQWVESASNWSLHQLQLMLGNGGATWGGDWFIHPIYAAMLGLGLALLPLFALLAIFQSWRSGSFDLLGQTLGRLVGAVLIAEGAVWATQALDGLSDDVAGAAIQALVGSNWTGFFAHLSAIVLLAVGGGAFAGAAAAVGVILIGFLLLATVVILLELFMRLVGIYLCLAFVPVAAAAMLNPSTRVWLHRLVCVEIGLILLKPTIAILLAIGAAMLSASPTSAGPQGDSGLVAILGGLVVLSITALSPMGLAKFVPWAEGNISSAATQKTAGIAAIPLRKGHEHLQARVSSRLQKRFPKMAAKAGLGAAAPPTVILQAANVIVRRAGDVGRQGAQAARRRAPARSSPPVSRIRTVGAGDAKAPAEKQS